jgi:hypothetical protein
VATVPVDHRHEHMNRSSPRSVCCTIIDATTAINSPDMVKRRYCVNSSFSSITTPGAAMSSRYRRTSSTSFARRTSGSTLAPKK